MIYEIKHRYSCAVLFFAEVAEGIYAAREALQKAFKAKADLSCAYLSGAYLSGAEDAKTAIAKTRILPQGSLIVWKKAGGKLVKMRVPEEAKRCHAFGRKCRAEYVDVLEVEGGGIAVTDQHGPRTEYEAGKRVVADKWDENFQNECSNGIHFFITREEAAEW